MKKLLTLTLAILMIASLSVTAFAKTVDEAGTTSIDVKAKYSGSIATPDVISVDITWGAMEFTYSVGGQRNWNAADHSYTDNSTAGWSASGNTVTVTNHSNVAVTAGFAYNPVAGSTVTGKFNVTSKDLAAGVVGDKDHADKVTSTLDLGGTLDASVTDFTKVGSIAVSIAKAN